MGAPVRLGFLWLVNPKFIHGVAGVIVDDQGRVLLLKHRFWKGQRWGLPGGLAHPGETPAATLRRKLLEETGLEVRPLKLLQVHTATSRLTKFILLAEASGEPTSRSKEIMDARYWDRSKLPDDLIPAHRQLLDPSQDWPGIPLEE